MRIECSYCGSRDIAEFTYLGAAAPTRPEPDGPEAGAAFYDFVYLRDNPAGPHRELWYHAQGCRAWLEVERDTRTHDILGVRLAASR